VANIASMEIISTSQAPAAIGPYSQAVRTGNLLFASGQIPIDPATGKIDAPDFTGQASQVFANIKGLLDGTGLTLNHVVKCTVFLKDMADFPILNPLYAAAFGDHKPARSTVQVAKLPLDALVEIEVIAEYPA
jgi:2-iminobutanoate/2-iminopropanoate deaminase